MKKTHINNYWISSISTLFEINAMVIIVIVLAFLAVNARSAQEGNIEKQVIQTTQLTGQWEGLYYTYPQPIVIKMELHSADGNKVEGELMFFPLDTKKRNIQGEKGKQELNGTYDSLTQTFELKGVKWIDNPDRMRTMPTLHGVMSVKRQEIAGFRITGSMQDFSSNAHFVMVRPAQANEYLNIPMIEIFTGRQAVLDRRREEQRLEIERRREEQRLERQRRRDERRGITTQSDSTSTEQSPDTETEKDTEEQVTQTPNTEDMVKWASKIKEEYPDMDLRGTMMGLLYNSARNLFEDKHFRKYFGKTFDQMTFIDRDAIIKRFREASQTPVRDYDYDKELTPIQSLKEYHILDRAFSDSGTGSAAEILLSVYAHCAIRAWRDEMNYSVRNWPIDADAFYKLLEFKEVSENLMSTLWPSEQKTFNTLLEEAKSNVAGPSLAALVERTIENAHNYQDTVELSKWKNKNTVLLESVSDELRTAALTKIDGRIGQLLQPLVAEEAGKISSFGKGYDAVTAGNKWYQNFIKQYGFARNISVVSDVIDRFMKRRSSDLAAAQEHIQAIFLKAETIEKLDILLKTWLVVPEDKNTIAGKALVQVADQRRQRLDLENRFSDREIAMMKTQLGVVDVPVNPELPTSEEIGLAIIREIEVLGGKRINRTTAQYALPPADSFGWYYIIALNRINMLDSIGHLSDDYHYKCLYSIKLNISLPQKFLDSVNQPGNPLSVLIQAIKLKLNALNSKTLVLLDNFVLTPTGWRSPTCFNSGFPEMFNDNNRSATSIDEALEDVLSKDYKDHLDLSFDFEE